MLSVTRPRTGETLRAASSGVSRVRGQGPPTLPARVPTPPPHSRARAIIKKLDEFTRLPAADRTKFAADLASQIRAVPASAGRFVEGRPHRPAGPLLETVPETMPVSPLCATTTDERLAADYFGTGLTVGRHPMYFQRERMNALGVTTAKDLANIRNGRVVRVAGCVIVRQRPGTAKGVVFLSVEDETGIFNVVMMPDMFEQHRLTAVQSPYLLVEGPVQNVEGVIHVQARRMEAIALSAGAASSHDFK
jgi:hypothetical protein